MNTSFFSTKEAYLAFDSQWKDRTKQRSLTRGDMALRAIILNRPILQSFTPKTNKNALANGYAPYSMLKNALYELNGCWLMSLYPELKNSEYLNTKLEAIKRKL